MENYLPGANINRRQVHNELTVLDDRTRFALPPPELTFRGYEHENFRMFRREFTSYILITGAQTESRRLEILQGVLQGPALTYYVTEIYHIYKNYEMKKVPHQPYNESPRSYLGRLRQAAHEADIKDEEHIESRFKTGLLPEIRKHCMRMCVMSHKDVLRKAEGYWNAELEDKASRNPINRRKKYTPLNTMENMGNQDYPDDDRYVEQTFEDLLQQGLTVADAFRTMGSQIRTTNYQNDNYNRQRTYPPRNNYRQPQQQNRQSYYNNGNRQRYNNYQNRPEFQRNQENQYNQERPSYNNNNDNYQQNRQAYQQSDKRQTFQQHHYDATQHHNQNNYQKNANTIPPVKGNQGLRNDNKNYDNFAYLEDRPDEYYYDIITTTIITSTTLIGMIIIIKIMMKLNRQKTTRASYEDDYYYPKNHYTTYKNNKKKQPTQHELYMAQKRSREEDNQQKRRTMSLRSGTAVNKTVASNTQGSNKRKQRKIRFEEPITKENFDPQPPASIQQNKNQQQTPQVISAIQPPPIEDQQQSSITPADYHQTLPTIQTTINEDTTMLEQPSNSYSTKENNPDQRNKGKGPAEQRPRPLRRKPRMKPEIEYDIVQDVANITAQIKIQDLIKLSPKLRRELHAFTSTRRKIEPSLNIKDIDDKLDPTAAYSTVHIQGKPVTCLYDTGAAKSCISRTLMDDLEMEIQKSSSTRFTLGNGAIQASQGIIKDVEIQIGNFVKIPITLKLHIIESDYTDSTSEEDDIIENQQPTEFYLKDDRIKYPLQLEEWTAPNGTSCYHVYTGESIPLTGNETTYLTGELPHTNSQELQFYPYPALYQPYDYQETSPILQAKHKTGEQEEELDDDEIAEIYGYDYDPYRYVQLRRQGATNDQDLFMLHEGIPVQQSLIVMPRPGVKILEIWTKEDLIVPINRSIYYHGKLHPQLKNHYVLNPKNNQSIVPIIIIAIQYLLDQQPLPSQYKISSTIK
ncbi:hypothetical protein BDC45DRAFT_574764 [Circinella umbellata]|nr:hypothetical protein BDC45DRAFT_574764 [Circinella umbellata]